MATATVKLTPAQLNWVMNRVNQVVQEESTANTAYSGDISNNPTFLANDLTVAEGTLAALKSAVIS